MHKDMKTNKFFLARVRGKTSRILDQEKIYVIQVSTKPKELNHLLMSVIMREWIHKREIFLRFFGS